MSLDILLVDDSATIRAIVRKTLIMSKIPIGQLYQAENGQAALAILEKKSIDLVFSDINMPVMTGVEMIEKMNERGMLETIPVIFISTEGSVQRIANLKEMGASAYLRKPFTPEQLKAAVDDVLDLSENGKGPENE